jgi:predicted ATPase
MNSQPDTADLQVPPNSISGLAVGSFKSLAEKQRIEVAPLTLLAGANSSGKSSIVQPLLLLKQTLAGPYEPGPLLLNGPNVKFTDASQLLTRTGFRTSSGAFGVRIVGRDGDDVTLHFAATEQGEIEFVRLAATLEGEESNLIADVRDAPLAIALRAIIHVPVLRGSPERTYKTMAVGEEFPGTFDDFVASVIAQWQAQADARLEQLSRDLEQVGLTTSVEAVPLDNTHVEIRVARVAHKKDGRDADMVNIADAGTGISQVLPVLVALLAARPGQLVYIEQPESHLHPRAQAALAPILARAAARGVKVVAETHSALLLRAVQTLVARGELAPDLVKLHWFERGEDGATTITSADLDENGAFGEWPADFDDVILRTEADYFDAVTFRA